MFKRLLDFVQEYEEELLILAVFISIILIAVALMIGVISSI